MSMNTHPQESFAEGVFRTIRDISALGAAVVGSVGIMAPEVAPVADLAAGAFLVPAVAAEAARKHFA